MRVLDPPSRRAVVAIGLLSLAAACGGDAPAADRAPSPGDEPPPPAPAWTVAPTGLDFGEVAPGERVERRLTLTNPGTAPVPVVVTLSPDPEGTISIGAVPAEVPAAGTAEVGIVYAPAAPGSHGARLRIEADGRAREVGVSGLSPGGWISCTPGVLVLPPAEVGEESRGAIACVAGAWSRDGAERVAIRSLEVEGEGFSAAVRAAPPPGGLAPGEPLSIDVAFRGTTPGAHQGRVVLDTSAGAREFPLAAAAWSVAPCSLALPGAFDLGLVPPGLRARVELPLENRRPDAGCLIASARLVSCDPGFRLETSGPFEVGPGATFGLPILFGAAVEGPWRCELALAFAAGEPEARIPLRALVDPSCLHVAPAVDFADTVLGCRERRELALHSACGPALRLDGVAVEEGPFSLLEAPPFPAPLATGGQVRLAVGYRPEALGEDAATLRLRFADGLGEIPVALRAGAVAGVDVVDRFQQNQRPKVDLLLVIENSTSMDTAQSLLGRNLRPFLSFAQAQELDYHLGVTTTGLEPGGDCPGGVGGGEDGRLVPVDGSRARWISPTTPRMETVWAENFGVGACRTGPSMPIEAALRALTPPLSNQDDDPRHPEERDGNDGFLRPDALLSVIFVTNRADESPGPVAAYLGDFLALKPRGRGVSLHAITGDAGTGCAGADATTADPGDRLLWLVEATHGEGHSICSADWEYALRASSALPFGFHTCFHLTNWPVDVDVDQRIADADVEVRLNGRVTPSRGDQGQRIWSYDPRQNAVCFNPLAVPEPGTALELRYSRRCD